MSNIMNLSEQFKFFDVVYFNYINLSNDGQFAIIIKDYINEPDHGEQFEYLTLNFILFDLNNYKKYNLSSKIISQTKKITLNDTSNTKTLFSPNNKFLIASIIFQNKVYILVYKIKKIFSDTKKINFVRPDNIITYDIRDHNNLHNSFTCDNLLVTDDNKTIISNCKDDKNIYHFDILTGIKNKIITNCYSIKKIILTNSSGSDFITYTFNKQIQVWKKYKLVNVIVYDEINRSTFDVDIHYYNDDLFIKTDTTMVRYNLTTQTTIIKLKLNICKGNIKFVHNLRSQFLFFNFTNNKFYFWDYEFDTLETYDLNINFKSDFTQNIVYKFLPLQNKIYCFFRNLVGDNEKNILHIKTFDLHNKYFNLPFNC